MKTQHYLLIAACLVLAYFLFAKKDTADPTKGTNAEDTPPNSGTSEADYAGNTNRSSPVSILPQPMVVKAGPRGKVPVSTPTGGRWFNNRQDAINQSKRAGCRFVEGTGANYGQYGCF